MSDPNSQRQDQVALFRHALIGELAHLPPGSKGIGKRLAEKAEQSYSIPHSTRCRVAAETLRHWLKIYRKGGYDALLPRKRKDAGQSHALPQEVADLLCQTKEDKPDLSVQLVIKEAIASGKVPEGLPLPLSTVHRLLSRAGLMRKRAEEAGDKDRRHFVFEHANDLWMSDVMHGPSVVVGGKVKRKTYLIAFIDDATRVVPFASFALSESTSAFLPVLKQAIMRRGVPKRLYVDNGSAFRSHQLALACAKLNITLIHARPYSPAGKGKQERWFRTCRLQLLPTLTREDTSSLEALNRRLWAYVEGEYHHAAHRGLDGLTPLDAWAKLGACVQYVGARPELENLFLFEEKRKVAKDRTVSLHGVLYEVEATLVGATVILRYEPDCPRAVVQVWAEGKRVADAKPVDAHANCFVRRVRRDASRPLASTANAASRGDDSATAVAIPTSTLRLSDMRRDGQKEGC
jgi:putative transposase